MEMRYNIIQIEVESRDGVFWVLKFHDILWRPLSHRQYMKLRCMCVDFSGVNILPLFVVPGTRNLLDPKLKTRKKLDP